MVSITDPFDSWVCATATHVITSVTDDSIRKLPSSPWIKEPWQIDPKLAVGPVKEDSRFVLSLNDRPDSEGQNKKQDHEAPGVKQHTEHEHDHESGKGVREFPEVKDRDGCVDCLTHSVAMRSLEKLIVIHSRAN